MGKSSGGETTKTAPWEGAQAYLLGSPGGTPSTNAPGGAAPATGRYKWQYDNNGQLVPYAGGAAAPGAAATPGTPGLYPEAARLYGESQFDPRMKYVNELQIQDLASRGPDVQAARNIGRQFMGGEFDPSFSAVGSTLGAPSVGVGNISSMGVDPTQAFSSLGGANPQAALGSLLSGQVNTATLDPVIANAARRMGENFNEQVIPAIGQSATGAGQYGGSRQGIAQGLAAKGLAYSQGDMAANLLNNAYQQAQQNQYGTANQLAGLGINNAQTNAARDLAAQQSNMANQLNAQQFNAGNIMQTGQFNANLGLQNNAQQMAARQQMLQNRLQGINTIGNAGALQNQNTADVMAAFGAPQNYDWQNLNRYAGIVAPGAGLGGQTTQVAPSKNPLAGAAGGALAGSSFGPWGAAIGGGLGLLGAM